MTYHETKGNFHFQGISKPVRMFVVSHDLLGALGSVSPAAGRVGCLCSHQATHP